MPVRFELERSSQWSMGLPVYLYMTTTSNLYPEGKDNDYEQITNKHTSRQTEGLLMK